MRLRFDHKTAPRPLATMTDAEQKSLERYRGTIQEQAEFGDVESVDVVDAESGELVYHLHWWPFTDGVLLDARDGALVGDLLDGVLFLTTPSRALRERLEAAFRDARASFNELIVFSPRGET